MFTRRLFSNKSRVIGKVKYFIKQFFSAVLIFMLFGFMQSFANAVDFNHASMSYTIENDGLLGTDRGYTSGLFASINSSARQVNHRLLPQKLTFLELERTEQLPTYRQWKFTLGQQIWTPTDITGEQALDQDRPYAGKVFIKAQLAEYNSDIADKYSVMLGTVGPRAMAEKSQKSVHSLIGSKEPVGWNDQIDNEVIYSFTAERQKLLYRASGDDGSFPELALGSRVQLGNYQNEVAINSTLRWGEGLSESFAVVGLRPGDLVDFGMIARSKEGSFFYTTVEARYRSLDITIDGDSPARFAHANVAHWQSSLAAGFVAYNQGFGLGFTVLVSSPDYQEDPNDYNAVASIKVFWRI